jgi:hypothetical protein
VIARPAGRLDALVAMAIALAADTTLDALIRYATHVSFLRARPICDFDAHVSRGT